MKLEDRRGTRWVAAALCCAVAVLNVRPAAAQSSLKSRRDFAVGDRPTALVVADYDGDGLLDVITVNRSSSDISLEKGFGDGTFRRAISVAVGSQPSSFAVADMNGDGLPDLVTGNLLSQDVTVNLGTGMGRFGAPLSKFIAAGHKVAFVPVQVIYRSERSKIRPVRDTRRWFRWWWQARGWHKTRV